MRSHLQERAILAHPQYRLPTGQDKLAHSIRHRGHLEVSHNLSDDPFCQTVYRNAWHLLKLEAVDVEVEGDW
jgi:hypothetical protein